MICQEYTTVFWAVLQIGNVCALVGGYCEHWKREGKYPGRQDEKQIAGGTESGGVFIFFPPLCCFLFKILCVTWYKDTLIFASLYRSAVQSSMCSFYNQPPVFIELW